VRLNKRRTRLWSQGFLFYRYFWRNLEAAVREAKQALPSPERVVLDIGCGHKPYADLFVDCAHVGLNNSGADASPDVIGDASRLPVRSHSVDLVVCTQVLEHVPRPLQLLEECGRVLKPGGWLIVSAPFYWPLHEEPHDYFRYTRHGLEHLLREAGLSCRTIRADGGDYARFCLSAFHILPKWLEIPLRIPLNILGMTLDRLRHRASLPANYTVLAQAPDRAAIPARGGLGGP
jgi:SAM-dependent methyltransferase